MSQIRSFQSNRDNLDDWLEGNGVSAVSSGSLDNMDMAKPAYLNQVPSAPPAPPLPVERATKNLSTADHYRAAPLPASNEASSFISALNSTISPRTKREPLVIPGAKRRLPTTQKLPESGRYLHPHLRLMIVLILIAAALLFTTLSLSPVGNGQVDVPVVGGFIQWAQDEQMRMNIAARSDPEQSVDTTTNNQGPTLPKSQYVAIAQAAAQKYGISPIYFVNQIQQESHFDPYAQSNAGAVGIAQFEPATAASMGINPYDPNAALDGAARFMSVLQVQFGGDYAKALAAYNGGSGAVQAAVRNCGAGWLSCMSPQTESYVFLIMR